MPSKDPQVVAVPQARGAIPYLIVKGAADAIAFYQRVFGAELLMRLDAPDGVMHAELQVGPAHFMLTEERPQYQSLGPVSRGGSSTGVIVYVPNSDEVVKRAVDAGATVTMPVADQFWGDRSGNITDPFGHNWWISTHIEDPTPEEITRRAKALFAQGGGC
jgi:PhnB protein